MTKRGYESQKTGQKVDELLDKIDNLNVPEWALQESKPSYTAQEVHALPENTSIPRNTSDLTNDMGYISHESDPTVPSWAKQPTKPAYTAEEVGALPSDTPVFSGDYNDLRNKPTIPTVPENVSAFNNDAGYLTSHQDISGKEDKSNKVTSLSAQSTDTQYPSAKAVYDELESKQDTINDLSTIRSGASEGATAYQKPQAGIPESDLAQGVKDKLNEKEVFVAEYGVTAFADIYDAIEAGKAVFVVKNNEENQDIKNYYGLFYQYSDEEIQFTLFNMDKNKGTIVCVYSDDSWDEWDSEEYEISSLKTSSWRSSPDNIHYPSEKLVKDSIDAVDKVFWATYGTTTAAEIDAAVAAGKAVLCAKDDLIYTLGRNVNNAYYFFCTNTAGTYYLYLTKNNNAWSATGFTVEKTSNRVNSWQSTPDNTHYPSEKLVKDSLDAKADIGDILFANFSRLTPKKTFEYDVSDADYHPLFSRANTGLSTMLTEVNDVVKFRMTVTGTNIHAVVDVVVIFQSALTYPLAIIINDTYATIAAISGIQNMRYLYPKAVNNGYDFITEFSCYNKTPRHFKIEVFEDTEAIIWIEEKTTTTYNSTYQNGVVNSVYLSRIILNQSWRMDASVCQTATSASYISSYLPIWIGGTPPVAGEALLNNQLAIVSGQKAYKVTNKNKSIDCDCGVFIIGTTYAKDAGLAYAYARQKIVWAALTGDPALTYDTFARGDQVYLRCTLGQDGKIYPDGHLSNVKSAGYTWVHIGTAASATAINLDTCGKPFITLNNDGKVTHINGTAVMDSSMSKWGVVSQTQTWTQASDGGYDYTMSNLVYGWIPKANIDLYEAAGAVFNETSGYFELNGLEDISYEEMGKIYRRGPLPQSPNAWTIWAQGAEERTFLPIITNQKSYNEGKGNSTKFTNNSMFEVCVFARNKNGIINLEVGTIDYAFHTCKYLKKIGNLLLTNTSTGAFTSCHSLETAYLYGIVNNIEFKQSPRLSVESILYMINNEASTSAITITLHPTAYARAIADSDVQAALQAHTNVSLASA